MDVLQEINFGETIKKIRKEQNMTQKMLSQGICAQSVLSRIENGIEVPNVIVLQQICQRLNITMDKLLYSQPSEIQQINALFLRIHYHLIHQNYQQMEQLLESSSLTEHSYLDTDLQLYYYYLGSCEFFLYDAHDAAIQSLKKGLSYTYTKGKNNVSAIEIQLMSCLGRVFGSAGNNEQATHYLNLAYASLQSLPIESMRFELSKVFYNFGSFLFGIEEDEKALEVAEQGILWAQQRSSYYYLEELFSLCGKICKRIGLVEEAKEYMDLSHCIQKIR